MSTKQVHALMILRDHGPLTPREFARLMWPDAPGWRASSNCGPNGAATGMGMPRAGGGYLGKPRKIGLVSTSHVAGQGRLRTRVMYELTNAGLKALMEWKACNDASK